MRLCPASPRGYRALSWRAHLNVPFLTATCGAWPGRLCAPREGLRDGTSPATWDYGENDWSAWVIRSGLCTGHGPRTKSSYHHHHHHRSPTGSWPPQSDPLVGCCRLALLTVLLTTHVPPPKTSNVPHSLHWPARLRSTRSTASSFTPGPSSSNIQIGGLARVTAGCFCQNHVILGATAEPALTAGCVAVGAPRPVFSKGM